MKRRLFGIVSILLVALILIGCLNPSSSKNSDDIDDTAVAITLLAIPGVMPPVKGEVPVVTVIDTPQYTGNISWNPAHSTFEANMVYTANITLTAKAGFTLTGVEANTFTVASATVTHAVNSGEVTAVFSSTSAVTINLLAIPGVTVPGIGTTPVTAIDTEQYTGIISWSPAHNSFEANTVYTANIGLTAKAGFTLTGVVANTFTVTGATVIHEVNSGAVVAGFPVTSLTMISVPAGSFQRDATETNISTITIPFRMSTNEITREQFVSVTGLVNPSNYFTGIVNGPVQMGNWYHALVFCNKLSIAEGLTRVYSIRGSTVPDAWDGTTDGTITVPTTASDAIWDVAICDWNASGYRLPTEMEWMWAAMGATLDRSNGYTGSGINTTGYTKGYAGSTEIAGAQTNIGNYAWYVTNSSDATHPVGTAGTTGHPNELGLYDMSGNVSEWCWDWNAGYTAGTLTNDRGSSSGLSRIQRGGAWNCAANICTVSIRVNCVPYGKNNTSGFRVVRN